MIEGQEEERRREEGEGEGRRGKEKGGEERKSGRREMLDRIGRS